MGVSLGLAGQASDDAIAKAVWALLTDAERRREMRSAGLMTIDGNAAARIASDLASALAQRRAIKEQQTAT
jgi:UDP-N-acetylglucosamine 2-epimerase